MSIGGPFDAIPGTAVPGTGPSEAFSEFEGALNMALGRLEVGVMDVRLVDRLLVSERVALSTAISLRRIADALEAANRPGRSDGEPISMPYLPEGARS